ncbi:MAG: MBL fold metallo-hydrolase [Clostridia bacterium]|nr:MBL fold metallo-hydrolase [Clostridia bacterium]
MSNFSVYTLFSGSKGNCTFVSGEKTQILIDAGMGPRSIEASLKSLGTSLENITDIFITHDHSDHTRGLEAICAKYDVTVHMTERSADAVITSLTPNLEKRLCVHPLLYTESTGELKISSFATPHDSNASVGYIIRSPELTLGFATDIGYVSDTVRDSLTGVDAVILEANHDITMLEEGNYPVFLKKRILSRFGHLSNDDAAEFAAYLAENGTKHFLLAHLSEQNNDPEAAFGAVYCALGNIRSRGITLAVAETALPTRLI